MGCNTLTSWWITRFLCKWGLFATTIYRDMGKMWSFTVQHYTTHVAPDYKTIFFVERGKRIHWYKFKPISLSIIRTIASTQLSSHALRCETGHTLHTLPLTSSRVLSITLCVHSWLLTSIAKVLEHRQSLTTHVQMYCVKCNIFFSHMSYSTSFMTSEDDNRISLSLSKYAQRIA